LNTSKVKPIWSSQTQKAFTKISHSKRGKAKEALNQDLLEQQTPRYWKARALNKVSLGSTNSKREKATMALKKKLSWHIRGKLDNLEILGS
jgi:hypothetical protein